MSCTRETGGAAPTRGQKILAATLRGAAWDAERDGYGVEVKAISYHELQVELGPPARLRVILDL